ncbi:hypothetical protein [Parasitella parasitica]|uniref:Uncharacterized protein n=1 Tax=Parasitella parasitica TaxID=35722 RepID=A0A0B7MX68_9FUNG|nr:hypothetical protein [Parasitella parasitica]
MTARNLFKKGGSSKENPPQNKMFYCDVDSCTGEMAKKATEVPYIRAQDVPLIKIPIIQVAGFSGKLSVLSLPKKKRQIQTGYLENLINFLSTIDDLLGDLRKIYHDNSFSTVNDIENILTEVNQKKKFNYNAWTTKATFEKEDDDDDDEDDEEDDEDDEEDDDEDEEEDDDEDEEEDKEEDDE